MDLNKIEKELVEQRSTVEKIVDKGGETLAGRVGHQSEIDKGEQDLASFLEQRAQHDQSK